MKSILYTKTSTDRLVYREVEKPVPADHEVLVRVMASSVNAADYRSLKLGIIPKRKIFGADIAGVVEAVGGNVTQFRPGDEVLGDLADSGFGGFAEYAAAPEKALVMKPAGLSFEEAAAIPLAGVTALQGLRKKGNIQPGQKVLIVGAGGGVGTFAVQLAKHFGAEVTAVCSTRNVEQTLSLGADHVVDYTKEDVAKTGRTYDLIMAVNGNRSLLSYKRLLNPGGIYVMVGGAMKQILGSLFFGWLFSFGSRKMRTLAAKPNQDDLGFLARLAGEGLIRPVIEATYPLSQTPEAMKHLSSGHARGKVVIRVE
jgi:NADPH:quinone reductase-like Zn-dependent oxidoreductase